MSAPDLDAAHRFLTLLDESTDSFTFQSVDDNKTRKSAALLRTLNGTLDQHAATLTDLNKRGAGVFVTVNQTDLKGRARENITGIRAVWQEDDGDGKPLPLEPHIVVESSPGKHHRYLRVDGMTADQHAAVMAVMVERYGCDQNAKDLCRVLRVPGFDHCKTAQRNRVSIVHESGARPYTAEEVLAAFDVDSTVRSSSRNSKFFSADTAGPVSTSSGGYIHPQRVVDLRAALSHIDADPRDTWVTVGAALHSTEAPEAFDLWDEWAKQSPKHDAADSRRVWASFQPDRGINVETVFALAKKAGWDGKLEPVSTDGPKAQWPTPQPLIAKVDPVPYPEEVLPPIVRDAVAEVATFTRAPVAMAAGCAMTAMALAVQSQYDVEREKRLTGPTSLFMLTVANSGERKSTVDGFFTKEVDKYAEEMRKNAAPEIKKHQADEKAWAAKIGGVTEGLKKAAKEGKDTLKFEEDLKKLELAKPIAPRVPRLIYQDATPEALAYNLWKVWPTGAVISSEGGAVLGGHAMSADSAMRNLATLNQLWDGTQLHIDRRTSDSFSLIGARLTMGVQVQESVLREFLEKTGALARGSGFLARFLLAIPQSTQGTRFFKAAPARWPALDRFNARMAKVLRMPAPLADHGGLEPAMLTLSPDARKAWIAYHDKVEAQLSQGAALHDVRDVASKSADNAARIAAVFHVFDADGIGPVSLDAFNSGAALAWWHLQEARRFFGEFALPEELADARRLDTWLVDHAKRQETTYIGKNYVRQFGPIRVGKRLDAAITELSSLDRLRLFKDGKRHVLMLNPAILESQQEKVAIPATDGGPRHG